MKRLANLLIAGLLGLGLAVHSHGQENLKPVLEGNSQKVITIKPRAPIQIDYTILGEPQVGQPLAIELMVSSPLSGAAVTVDYHALNSDEMTFAPASGNTSQRFKLADVEQAAKRVINVVPRKEGRSLFNVTAQIETANGLMSYSRAIPIQVGDLPATKVINGALIADEHGEMIISMPAN